MTADLCSCCGLELARNAADAAAGAHVGCDDLADFQPSDADWAESFRCNPIAPAWVEAVEGVSSEEIRQRCEADGCDDPFAGN